jgi:hypothetical protein
MCYNHFYGSHIYCKLYCSGLLESQIIFVASKVLCDAHITQFYQVQLLLMFLASDHEPKGENCNHEPKGENCDNKPVSQHIILPPHNVSIRTISVRKIGRDKLFI